MQASIPASRTSKKSPKQNANAKTISDHCLSIEELQHASDREISTAACLSDIINIIEHNDIKYVSFDIFDTLLSRGFESERKRFFRIAEAQAKFLAATGISISEDDIYVARIRASQMAYRFTDHRNGSREASIQEIYMATFRILNISTDLIDELIDIEIYLESKSLSLNNEICRIIDLIRSKCIVELVTDMYLDVENIHKLFFKMNSNKTIGNINIWSSAETKFTKNNGSLFRHLSSHHNVAYGQMLHIGDNDISEISIAYSLGMQAIHLPIRQDVLDLRKKCEKEIKELKGI